ncbi:hypothetical protein LguiB_001500 [Lonicera macranthoides]
MKSNIANIALKVFVLMSVLSGGYVLSKECTNAPGDLSSHTVRYEIMTSNNETLQTEYFAQFYHHNTSGDNSTWAGLRPRKGLSEDDENGWVMMYKKIKDSGGFKVPDGLLNEVGLSNVRLDPGSIHGQAQLTNLEYLFMLDVDRLAWSFRKTAALPTPGEAYGGWEAPDNELRGHFVGHYLSATAQMWASTGNNKLKEKMSALVSALSACQEKIGTGYLSAFPSDYFDRLEALQQVWAPYYTIHKILAGLLDQHKYANDTQALKMAKWMADYFFNRVQNVISEYSIERHWQILNDETGGMNDVLYRLYSVTGDMRHLWLAHLFDKPCFIGVLAMKADDISGFHANTHIPIVLGSQMRYEITGDPFYKEIGTYFVDIVNSSHTYTTGGTSVDEHWGDPKRLGSTLKPENEESCSTHNMLKVSRNLFRWTKEISYADYYERALTNGVLSIQRGREPGVMIYFLPLDRGSTKARSKWGWGTKNESFWCCYGTGIESFSKLGDSIYFEEKGEIPVLYIIQYISSTIDWKAGNISLIQKVEPLVSWDNLLRVSISISSNEKGDSVQPSNLTLRIPFWTHSEGAKASLNGQYLALPSPGNYLTLTRKWSTGDQINLELPVILRTDPIQDDQPSYAALHGILYGPYLLAGLSNGDWDIRRKPTSPPADWITPISPSDNSYLITLCQHSGDQTFALEKSNTSVITMGKLPEPGSNSSVHATFRLILTDPQPSNFSKPRDAIGKQVMLEPFDLPGMVVVQKGKDRSRLKVEDSSTNGDGRSVFRLLPGLDGNNDTVSLESESHRGCFVASHRREKSSGGSIRLRCKNGWTSNGGVGSGSGGFEEATSFQLKDGVSSINSNPFPSICRSIKLTKLNADWAAYMASEPKRLETRTLIQHLLWWKSSKFENFKDLKQPRKEIKGCQNFKNGVSCGFFLWVDPPISTAQVKSSLGYCDELQVKSSLGYCDELQISIFR